MLKQLYLLSCLLSPSVFAQSQKEKLNKALLYRDKKVVQAMVKAGADLNKGGNGWPALLTAYKVWCDFDDNIKKSQQIPVNPQIQKYLEEEAKKNIGKPKFPEFLDFLYSLGANPNLSTWSGNKPILNMLIDGRCPISEPIIHLINHKANLTAADGQGNTALHAAVDADQEKFVKLLIENKADLKVKNKAGQNPLDLAILSFHTVYADEMMKVGGTTSKPAAELYKERGRDRNDVQLRTIRLMPEGDEALVLVKSAMAGIQIGQKRMINLEALGEVKSIQLRLVDLKSKLLPNEVSLVQKSNFKAEVNEIWSFQVPPVPFRFWVFIQNLDGKFTVNQIEPEVMTPVPASNQKSIARPRDPKEMMSYWISRSLGFDIKVNSSPKPEDLSQLNGVWIEAKDLEGFVAAKKKGQEPPPSLEAFQRRPLFEISSSSCKTRGLGDEQECKPVIKDGIVQLQEVLAKNDPMAGFGEGGYQLYLTSAGPFLGHRDSGPAPLVKLGKKDDAIPAISTLFKRDLKMTMNPNPNAQDFEKLVGTWKFDSKFPEGAWGPSRKPVVESFEITVHHRKSRHFQKEKKRIILIHEHKEVSNGFRDTKKEAQFL